MTSGKPDCFVQKIYISGVCDCRFVNHMLHKREKEREPHEEISTREGA